MLKSIILAATAALALASPATAATFKPLYGGKSLVMTGPIVEGDPQRLRAAVLAANRNRVRVERIFLNSPGGRIDVGVQLGMLIAGDGTIDTVVGKTDSCSSSCVTVFAAGKNKVVFPTSRIGVHSATAVNMKTGARREDTEATVLMIRLYKSIGVPASVLGKMAATEPGEITWLDVSDYTAWGLTMLQPTGAPDRKPLF